MPLRGLWSLNQEYTQMYMPACMEDKNGIVVWQFSVGLPVLQVACDTGLLFSLGHQKVPLRLRYQENVGRM